MYNKHNKYLKYDKYYFYKLHLTINTYNLTQKNTKKNYTKSLIPSYFNVFLIMKIQKGNTGFCPNLNREG